MKTRVKFRLAVSLTSQFRVVFNLFRRIAVLTKNGPSKSDRPLSITDAGSPWHKGADPLVGIEIALKTGCPERGQTDQTPFCHGLLIHGKRVSNKFDSVMLRKTAFCPWE